MEPAPLRVAYWERRTCFRAHQCRTLHLPNFFITHPPCKPSFFFTNRSASLSETSL